MACSACKRRREKLLAAARAAGLYFKGVEIIWDPVCGSDDTLNSGTKQNPAGVESVSRRSRKAAPKADK